MLSITFSKIKIRCYTLFKNLFKIYSKQDNNMTKITSYTVPSNSLSSVSYVVKYNHGKEHYTCTCPDFIHRCSKNNEMCKHIQRIKSLDDNGFVVEHETYESEEAKLEQVEQVEEISGELKGAADKDVELLLLDIVTNQQKIVNSSISIVSSIFEKMKF